MMLPALLFAAALAQDPAAPPPAPAVDATAGQSHIDEGLALFKRKRFAAAKRHFQAAVDAKVSSTDERAPAQAEPVKRRPGRPRKNTDPGKEE